MIINNIINCIPTNNNIPNIYLDARIQIITYINIITLTIILSIPINILHTGTKFLLSIKYEL